MFNVRPTFGIIQTFCTIVPGALSPLQAGLDLAGLLLDVTCIPLGCVPHGLAIGTG